MGRDIFSLFFITIFANWNTLEFCQHAFKEIPYKTLFGKGKVHLQKVLTVNLGKWSQWWQCWLNLEFSFHGDTQHHQHVYHTQGSRQERSSEKAGISDQPAFFLHSRILFTKVTNFFLQIAFGAPLIQRLANSTGISLVNFANPRFLLAMHITLWFLALSSPKGVF